jgi:hypothetical protein
MVINFILYFISACLAGSLLNRTLDGRGVGELAIHQTINCFSSWEFDSLFTSVGLVFPCRQLLSGSCGGRGVLILFLVAYDIVAYDMVGSLGISGYRVLSLAGKRK